MNIFTKMQIKEIKQNVELSENNMEQNIYFKPYFCSSNTFCSRKVSLHAFTASRKSSHKFFQASCNPEKCGFVFTVYHVTFIRLVGK